jgi:hypothetical protein
MKRLGWPRPPLILGVVLGDIVERYLFISVGRYGTDWLLRPVVAAVFVLALWGLFRPFVRELRASGGFSGMIAGLTVPRFNVTTAFYVGFITLLTVMMMQAWEWNLDAKIVPMIVGVFTIFVTTVSLLFFTFGGRKRRPTA